MNKMKKRFVQRIYHVMLNHNKFNDERVQEVS